MVIDLVKTISLKWKLDFGGGRREWEEDFDIFGKKQVFLHNKVIQNTIIL
jgi:hypothetical protein